MSEGSKQQGTQPRGGATLSGTQPEPGIGMVQPGSKPEPGRGKSYQGHNQNWDRERGLPRGARDTIRTATTPGTRTGPRTPVVEVPDTTTTTPPTTPKGGETAESGMVAKPQRERTDQNLTPQQGVGYDEVLEGKVNPTTPIPLLMATKLPFLPATKFPL